MDSTRPTIEPRILLQHPDSQCRVLTLVAASVQRSGRGVALIYGLQGDLSQLVLAEGEGNERRDELWRSTCFEFFVRGADQESYLEFNFATSGGWNAYQFAGYRSGMSNADVPAPFLDRMYDQDGIYVTLDLTEEHLAALPAAGPWRAGLAVVIEETSGAKSYWALAHPPGKPDFHHQTGFALELL